MDIKETVVNLQKVFDEMGAAFSSFQRETGLPCLPGCGTCCLSPEIEATILECLPLALKVYREGRLEEFIARLETSDRICILWEGDRITGSGRCTSYEQRPPVCRMFGVAGQIDKTGKVKLSTCKFIKAAAPEHFQKIESEVTPDNTPLMNHWYRRVLALENGHMIVRRPINEAMLEAMQLIGFHAKYQEL